MSHLLLNRKPLLLTLGICVPFAFVLGGCMTVSPIQAPTTGTGTTGQAPLTIAYAAASLSGIAGTAVTADTVSYTGGAPTAYSVTAGSLPTGLTLNSSNGSVTGTPTASGSYSVTIEGSNSSGSASTTLTGTIIPLRAYVSDWVANVYVCSTSPTNGGLSNCTATPSSGAPAWVPSYVTIAALSGGNFAYVADSGGNVYVCSVNTTTGALSGCGVTPSSGAPSWNMSGDGSITVMTFGGTTYVYVATSSSVAATSGLYICAANQTTGALSGCTKNTGPWGFPDMVTFGTASGTNYAYVADNDNDAIWKCSVNTSTGVLSGCATTPSSGAPAWNPFGITLGTVGGVNYAYVADQSNPGNVYVCLVSSADGSLSSCVTSDGGDSTWAPGSITLNTLGSNTYAYVADWNGNLDVCTVNPTNGTLSSCEASPSSGAPTWTPGNVHFFY